MEKQRSRSFTHIAVFASVLLQATIALGADTGSRISPAIHGHGGVYAPTDKDPAYAVSPHQPLKTVFDLSGDMQSPKVVDPALEKIARSINLYVADGVPLDHLNCAIVIGRGSAAVALDDQHYRNRFGVANPNIELLSKLHAAGVQVVASEQALADQGFGKNDLAPNIKVALSSVTALSALTQSGYVIMPL